MISQGDLNLPLGLHSILYIRIFINYTIIMYLISYLQNRGFSEGSDNIFHLCVRRSGRGVQTVACGPHAVQDGYERAPTQNCILTENIMRFFVFVSVCVFNVWLKTTLLCGSETPKCWTPW